MTSMFHTVVEEQADAGRIPKHDQRVLTRLSMPEEMLWMVNLSHNVCVKWFPLFVYAVDFGSCLDV